MKGNEHVQLTLPECMVSEVQAEPRDCYATEFFEIVATRKSITNFEDKLDVVKKNGQPKFTEEQKAMMKRRWIEKKMHVAEDAPDIAGKDWEGSREAIYAKVFGEDAGPKAVP